MTFNCINTNNSDPILPVKVDQTGIFDLFKLPPEIVRSILSYVVPDYNSLKSCMWTCKKFRQLLPTCLIHITSDRLSELFIKAMEIEKKGKLRRIAFIWLQEFAPHIDMIPVREAIRSGNTDEVIKLINSRSRHLLTECALYVLQKIDPPKKKIDQFSVDTALLDKRFVSCNISEINLFLTTPIQSLSQEMERVKREHTIALFLLKGLVKSINESNQYSYLRMTIENNDYSLVEFLLENKTINPSFGQDSNESNLLRLAINLGNNEIVKALLRDKRIDPCIGQLHPDDNLLRLSIEKRYYEIIKTLLEDGRIDPTMKFDTFCEDVRDRNLTTFVKLLIDKDRLSSQGLNQTLYWALNKKTSSDFVCEISGSSKLMAKIARSSEQEIIYSIIIKTLISSKDNKAIFDFKGCIENITAYEYALVLLAKKNLAGVTQLFEILKPNIEDSRLVEMAHKHGYVQLVKKLMPNTFNNEAILQAWNNGHADVLRKLLNDGHYQPDYILTQLLKSTKPCSDLFKEIFQTHQEHDIYTLLKVSLENGNEEILYYLLEQEIMVLLVETEASELFQLAFANEYEIAAMKIVPYMKITMKELNIAIKKASQSGNLDFIKFILNYELTDNLCLDELFEIDSPSKFQLEILLTLLANKQILNIIKKIPDYLYKAITCGFSEDIIQIMLKEMDLDQEHLYNALCTEFELGCRRKDVILCLLNDPRYKGSIQTKELNKRILIEEKEGLLTIALPILDISSEDLHEAIHTAIDRQSTYRLTILLADERVRPFSEVNEKVNIKNDDFHTLKVILESKKIGFAGIANIDAVFQLACTQNHSEIVGLLRPYIHPETTKGFISENFDTPPKKSIKH